MTLFPVMGEVARNGGAAAPPLFPVMSDSDGAPSSPQMPVLSAATPSGSLAAAAAGSGEGSSGSSSCPAIATAATAHTRGTPSSGESSDDERRKKKKKHSTSKRKRKSKQKHGKAKKHKKESKKHRKHEPRGDELASSGRAAVAAGGTTAGFVCDKRGDRTYVQLDSVYRGDVPMFAALRGQGRDRARGGWGRRLRGRSGAVDDDDGGGGGGGGSRRGRYWQPDDSKQLGKRGARRRVIDLSGWRGPAPRGSPDFVSLHCEAAGAKGGDQGGCGDELGDGQQQGESLEARLLRRTREFNEATRARPGDASLWLRFVDFQEEFAPALGRGRRRSGRSQAAIAEKQVAILSRALQPDACPGSERLLYRYLELCSRVWEPARARQAWDAAVRQHPTSLRLWRRYLAFAVRGADDGGGGGGGDGGFGRWTLGVLREEVGTALQRLSDLAAAATPAGTQQQPPPPPPPGRLRLRRRRHELERVHLSLLVDFAHSLQVRACHAHTRFTMAAGVLSVSCAVVPCVRVPTQSSASLC
eukprot:COSAG01_NODE_2859_length_6958_cov_21.603994_1_plen_529_part_00